MNSHSSFKGKVARAVVLAGFTLLLLAPAALAAPPTATTDPAGPVHHTSAVLNGHHDPDTETITDCRFEWISDDDFIANGDSYSGPHAPGTLPCDQGNSFNAPAEVSVTVGFLSAGLTYHFRLAVTGSSSGVIEGADRTFFLSGFPIKREELGAFGPDGTSGSSFSANGFRDLAFDQGARRLYGSASTDPVPNLYGFGASAPLSFPPLSGFSPLGLSNDANNFGLVKQIAVDSASGNIYVAPEPRGVGERQKVTVDATAGTFKLCFDPDGGGPEASECTGDLAYDIADVASNDEFSPTVTEKLQSLPAIGESNVFVRGENMRPSRDAEGHTIPNSHPVGISPYVVSFNNALGNTDVPQLTCDGTNLSGGSGCSVTTIENGVPDKIAGYDPAGNPLGGSFPIPLSGKVSGNVTGNASWDMAVDSAGHLWITSAKYKKVLEFDSTGAQIGSVDVSAQINGPRDLVNGSIAFDSNDDLYVSGSSAQGTWRYSAASGYTDATQVDLPGNTAPALAVDPSAHDLLVNKGEGNGIAEYDSRGNPLGSFGGTLPDLNVAGGIAVDGANHYVYVTTRQFVNPGVISKIHVFGPPIPTKLATVTGEPASDVLAYSATLNAKVDPETSQVSDCHFEYVDDAHYEAGTANPYAAGETASCSPDPGSGSGDVDVSAAISNLKAGTTYHSRIVAANVEGTSKGPDVTLTTLGPQIHSSAGEWNAFTATSARFKAKINPEEEETSYLVEYVSLAEFESEGYAAAKSTAAAGIGNGDKDVDVAAEIANLAPASAYVARFAATNASGTSYGPDLRFATFPEYGVGGPCPNDDFRTGPSAALPDCRAYEQASPVQKNGADVGGKRYEVQAALDGSAASYVSTTGLPGGVGGADFPKYIARRGASGWTTQGVLPPPSFGQVGESMGWTPDLKLAFSRVGNFGYPSDTSSMLAQDLASGTYQTLFPYTVGGGASFDGASADDSKLLLDIDGGTVPVDGGQEPSADSNVYLYDRNSGELTLVGVLPEAEGGVAAPGGSTIIHQHVGSGGAYLGTYLTQDQHAISESGDKAFFFAEGSNELYMRRGLNTPNPDTVRVTASQRSSADPAGSKPKTFMQATPSGSVAFFTSCEKLTDDATATSTAASSCETIKQGSDLYAYDTASEHLTDLSVDGTDSLGAAVQGVLGTSDKGDYVYFAANGVLASNAGAQGSHAEPGNCADGKGSCNLYLWRAEGAGGCASAGGCTTFIASLTPNGLSSLDDSLNWSNDSSTGEPRPSLVSADGHTLLFRSQNELTGFDNRTATAAQGAVKGGCGNGQAGQICPQFFRYEAGSGALSCLTCDPTGAPPTGRPHQFSSDIGGLLVDSNFTPFELRSLSRDGKRFFFETTDKMAAPDVNGDAGCPPAKISGSAVGACQDVYEWEAPGSGSCQAGGPAYSPANGGCIYLLSSGTGSTPAFFGDASASGNDAFIFSRSQLVPQDQDKLQDLYDVRVEGGLASQHQVAPPPCGTPEQCRGQGSVPPAVPGAGTAAIEGAGNPKPHRKAAKKHHRKAKKKHHKRHHKGAQRRANHDRRASR